MTAHHRTLLPLPRAAAVLTLAGCAAVAGCSSSGSAGSPAAAPPRAPGAAAPHGVFALPAHGPTSASRVNLTSLPQGSGQDIVYTATLTVRVASPARAAQRATSLAAAAGGYVSNENAALAEAGHGAPTVTIQVRVPVARYTATLAALTRLGTTVTQTQRTSDVTQAVADVSSRVDSAQAAIRQLRALLKRAGSVASLLTVQDQVNAEEASLEALLAQQRALARETSYATVSLSLVTAPHHARTKKPVAAAAGGFLGGLGAGWRALRGVVWALLTAAGAALPFAVPALLLFLLVRRLRSWFTRKPRVRRLERPTG